MLVDKGVRACLLCILGIVLCRMYILVEKLRAEQFGETFGTLFVVFGLFILVFAVRLMAQSFWG